jgi:biopolymer transport protein ExbB/TolQ
MNQPPSDAASPGSRRPSAFVLRHGGLDPEARLGLPSGRFTNPSAISSMVIGGLFMATLYGVVHLLRGSPAGDLAWRYLTGFSGIPIPMAALACWAVAILLLKSLKISAQRRALNLRFVPAESGFVLNVTSVGRVIDSIESTVDQPGRFLYLNRVLRALRSVRNVGRAAEIDEMLRSQAEADEAVVEGGYTLVRGFVWAIPVLGFIGTIVGLTEAIGRFGGVLAEQDTALEEITMRLTEVIQGLETAFVTTGEGLVAALAIHLLQTFVRRQDEAFLDAVGEECTASVVSRVRLVGGRDD